ncbi:MAG: hypothetical protein ABWZ40_07240 [Caulobacterales bacterium]
MSERLILSTRKGLFDLRRSGANQWRVAEKHFLGSPVSISLRDPRDGALYAALNLGHFGCKLHRSDDDGATWTEINAPSYAGVEGDNPPVLKMIWSLEAGGADQPGWLWCGTIPGGLFISKDRGDSWELVRSLWDQPSRPNWFGGGFDEAGIHSISVDPRDSKRVVIAVSIAGVWETADAGASWALLGHGMRAEYVPPETAGDPLNQDVHRLVRCAAAPDYYWVQHHNGMFRSTNGPDAFSEITGVKPSAFGFGVAVHPKDPRTAWFVPAVKDEFRYPVDGQLVVTRTRDGGATFDVLRNGLPQSEAYHLVYRHGLDVDESGDLLAFGSTTGGLWTTENGGDEWVCVSQDLPPINALRFV